MILNNPETDQIAELVPCSRNCWLRMRHCNQSTSSTTSCPGRSARDYDSYIAQTCTVPAPLTKGDLQQEQSMAGRPLTREEGNVQSRDDGRYTTSTTRVLKCEEGAHYSATSLKASSGRLVSCCANAVSSCRLTTSGTLSDSTAGAHHQTFCGAAHHSLPRLKMGTTNNCGVPLRLCRQATAYAGCDRPSCFPRQCNCVQDSVWPENHV